MAETRVVYNAIEAIEATTKLFYMQKNKDGYAELQKTLGYIMEAINFLYGFKEQTGYNQDDILAILNKAMTSLEKQDMILLSDILEYELKEELTKAVQAVELM